MVCTTRRDCAWLQHLWTARRAFKTLGLTGDLTPGPMGNGFMGMTLIDRKASPLIQPSQPRDERLPMWPTSSLWLWPMRLHGPRLRSLILCVLLTHGS